MFAIIETAGSQHKVAKGQILQINKLDHPQGAIFDINEVLLISDATDTKVGQPYVQGSYVTAKVISHELGEKILVYKQKAKKRYSRKKGHRQHLTTIEITDLKASGSKPKAVKSEEKMPELKEEKAPKAKVTKKKTVKKEV